MSGNFTINLRDEEFLVPEGKHLVEVEDVVLKTTNDGSSQYLNLRLRVMAGHHAGSTLWTVLSLRDDLRASLKRQLRALGFVASDLRIEVEEEAGTLAVVEPNLAGSRAIALVVHAEWNGEVRAKVRTLLPLEEQG